MISFPLAAGALRTRVLSAGDGARNVLFLHGAGARADRWGSTVSSLGALGFRCFAIDFPGHGFATKGGGPDYSVAGFVRFTLDVMDALGLERPAIVGTSLGGHVAAALALRAPHRVRALSLVGAVGLSPLPPGGADRIGASLARTSRADVEAKLRFVMRNPDVVTQDLIEEEWRTNTSPGAQEGFERLGRYFVERHHEDLLGPRLAAMAPRPPIQIIWGEEDYSTPLDMGLAAATLLTDGVLQVVPAAGHAPYFDAPSAFQAFLTPFLESLLWTEAA